MDSRMRRVLQKLAHHKSPTLATDLFSPSDAPIGVVSAQLRNACVLGLCDKTEKQSNLRFWMITDAGRAALKEPA